MAASAPVMGLMNPARFAKFHLFMMGLWAAALLPTLIWWKESILWVAFMSLYANFATHWSSYQGARAEKASYEHP